MFKKLKEKLEEEHKSSVGQTNPFGIPVSNTPTIVSPTIITPTTNTSTSGSSNFATPKVSKSTTSIVNPNYVITSPSLISPEKPDLSTTQVSTVVSPKAETPTYSTDLLVDLTPVPSLIEDTTPTAVETLTSVTPIETPSTQIKETETKWTLTDGVEDGIASDRDQLISSHKKEMDQLTARVQEVMKTNLELIKEKESMKSKSNQDNETIRKLNEQIKTLMEEKLALDAKSKSLSSFETRIKQLSEENMSKISERDATIADRDAKIEILDKEIKRLQLALNSKDEENVKLNHTLMEQASDFEEKIKTLEAEISVLRAEIKDKIEDRIPRVEHESALNKLEEIISEKNKTLKLQQQRISDLKKSIQKGDFPASPIHGRPANEADNLSDARSKSPSIEGANGDATLRRSLSNNHHTENCCHSSSSVCLDINFEYLKNVVFKFMTARDLESQKQLVKAISTLLQFNPDQELVIREFIDWKTSWLSALPVIGPNLAPHHNLLDGPLSSASKK